MTYLLGDYLQLENLVEAWASRYRRRGAGGIVDGRCVEFEAREGQRADSCHTNRVVADADER